MKLNFNIYALISNKKLRFDRVHKLNIKLNRIVTLKAV